MSLLKHPTSNSRLISILPSRPSPLQRNLYALLNLHPRTRNHTRAFSLRQLPHLLPHQLQLNVPRRDAHLLRAPAVLPQRQDLAFFRGFSSVVVACYVAEAEEDIGKAVLCVLVGCLELED